MTNVRLQNLRDFTVQIRNAKDEIVGTGIAVSMDGRIVTCRHVVETALRHKNIEGAEVGVYFPQLRGGEEKKRKAIVEKYFPSHDDDVVMLKLDGAFPLAPEQIPALGMADSSDGNLFRSYGYRGLEKYIAGWADGKIQGCVESPENFNVQCEPVQLESSQINAGMSGSAVLDTSRNLIVGIVSETWFPDLSTKDRDTAWAVDGRVLSLEPLGLILQDMPLPLKAAPSPKFDIAQAEAAVFIKDKYSWNSAPSVLTEWTGRDDLLAQITEDWNNPQKHVTGLIGFGGEGKSSLARKWVDDLGRGEALLRPYGAPDGVFWWGFYENRSIDEFLEAALNYLSGGRIDPRQVPSSSLRAQIIGAMLGAGRYLFVLDGLEVLQHQEGDQYGLLQSNDLRDLLTYFARPDNASFCLITSRAPLLDLMEYTTYTHRDVDRLSEADGILLLEKLGVKGSKEQQSKVVTDWDGHALTISLLGSYLAEKYNGDITHLADIPIPTADEPRYERVHRVLRRYDEHLTKDEREFLKLFSIFRLPVKESAFEKVFEPLLNKITNTDSQTSNIVNRLVNYRLIRHDEHEQSYTTHPLIRNHYFTLFTKGDSDQGKDAHIKIKDYYLSISGENKQYPTLDDLKPFIEVVHHACQAGAYDEAFQVYRERVSQETRYVLAHQLGASETEITVMFEFFPQGDTLQEPQINNSDNKRFVLNQIGFCLMSLGRLREAVPFYERAAQGYLSDENWGFAGRIYQNLADLHAHLGALVASAEAARKALNLVRKADKKQEECWAAVRQGWVNSLQGYFQESLDSFALAENLEKEISKFSYLYSITGIQHADHLRRTGDLDYARRVTEANLKLMVDNHWPDKVSMAHRVLGDLDFDPSTGSGRRSSNPEFARAHYESALKIARSISHRAVLIEALLARGRFYAKIAAQTSEVFKTSEVSVEQAFTDLNEALNYAVESGYRIYEADIRVALAWAYLANGEKEKAKQSAQRALQMSQEMGYHWGKVDGEEVMERMNEEG